jgi:cytidylate kinase
MRRHKELTEKGIEKTLDEIQQEIERRDYNDSNRALAPLKQADDAILIDSTKLSVDDVVNVILNKIKEER